MNNMTKKLQKMVCNRKSGIVVSKQKDFKKYKRIRESSTNSDYSSGCYDYN